MNKLLLMQAKVNLFNHIQNNTYPGRIIVLGLNKIGQPVIIYVIMGRSSSSRNRGITLGEMNALKTVFADEKQAAEDTTGDPDLLLYEVMIDKDIVLETNVFPKEEAWTFVVSNGKQTSDLLEKIKEVRDFQHILEDWSYEPDKENTPRISGMIVMPENENFSPIAFLSVIKKAPGDENVAQHNNFRYMLTEPALGFCVSTYMGDGKPLPAFTGEPLAIPIEGNTEKEIADWFWSLLDEDNRVSIAVKVVKSRDASLVETTMSIFNRFQKITA